MAYRFSGAAEADLLMIYRISVAEFGTAQAEAYFAGLERSLDFLADHPLAARERAEIKPSVRVHPYTSHLIVYRVDAGDVLIPRIRHAREDWENRE